MGQSQRPDWTLPLLLQYNALSFRQENFMSTWGSPSPFQSGPVPLGYRSEVGSQTMTTFFNSVYGWMAAGLGMTAVVAWWTASHPAVLQQVMGRNFWFLVIAELILVVIISAAAMKLSAIISTALFMLYSALNGLTLGWIFYVFTLPSITGTFIACAAMFVGMSIFGLFTQRDFSGYRRILFGALLG
jgi:uncharacterized protein